MQDLVIKQKIEDMIAYGYVALREFPKHERHVLSQEVRSCMWQLLEKVVICNKRYYKKNTLQEIDVTIDILRSKIRLAHSLKYLPMRKYEHWSRMVDEIGRLTGGWIKSMRKT
jgi:hypothetical protein